MQIEKCEVCGKHFVAGYGYSIAACWIVTGSAYVPAYMCDHTENNPQDNQDAPQHSGQHWGCSPEHAMQALDNCLKEHMNVEGLMAKHKVAHSRQQDDGTFKQRPRYSDEDASWAKDKGEDFHIVDFNL